MTGNSETITPGTTRVRRYAPVLGVIATGTWQEELSDSPDHPEVPSIEHPAARGRVQFAFLVNDANARSIVASRSYVICVPFDDHQDRWPGSILVCTRSDPTFPSDTPVVETSLARVSRLGEQSEMVLEQFREIVPKDRPERPNATPLAPTHRVIGVHRTFP